MKAVSLREQLMNRLRTLARDGRVKLGLPNSPDVYPTPRGRVGAGVVERLVDADREG